MRRQGVIVAAVAALLGLAMPLGAQDAHLEAAARGAAAAPVFSPPAGTHSSPLSVTLATSTAGAAIYYTTDGSSPSRKTSPVYKGPIQLTATATLKAFAYKKGLELPPARA